MESTPSVPLERIGRAIHLIRGRKVILAAELAALCGVVTWRLNEQVKRNKNRFPDDFVFQLTPAEDQALTSQIARSNTKGRGGRRTLPFAFTEHGVIMAAMVLNSPRAVAMSTHIVRAFVRLREMLASNAALAQKLTELEHRLEGHDHAIRNLFETVRQLLSPPSPPKRPIGFHVQERHGGYMASSLRPK